MSRRRTPRLWVGVDDLQKRRSLIAPKHTRALATSETAAKCEGEREQVGNQREARIGWFRGLRSHMGDDSHTLAFLLMHVRETLPLLLAIYWTHLSRHMYLLLCETFCLLENLDLDLRAARGGG